MHRSVQDRIQENDALNQAIDIPRRQIIDEGFEPLVAEDALDHALLLRSGRAITILPEEMPELIKLLTKIGRANGVIR